QGRQAAIPEDPGRSPPLPRSRDPPAGRGTSPGGDRLKQGGRPRVGTRTDTIDHPLTFGLAPHGPDPWAARDRDLAGDLEAVAAVPGEGPLAGGLQVDRQD